MKKAIALLLILLIIFSVPVISFSAEEVYTAETIFFDATGWEDTNTIYCHIWEMGNESFFPWQSNKERCTKVSENLYSYDLSKLDKTKKLSADKDYGIVFSSDTNIHTYDLTFGVECLGDTVKLSMKMIENYANPQNKDYEAVWTNNSDKYGPHLYISSIGNIIGSHLSPNERSEKTIATWIAKNYNNTSINVSDILANAFPVFGITTYEQIKNICSITTSMDIEDDESTITEIVEAAALKANISLKPSSDFEYIELDDNTVELKKYSGTDSEIIVPTETNGKKVSRIGDWAFAERNNLTSVTIPNTITSLGDFSFKECTKLKHVFLGERLTKIGSLAFWDCTSLESINIPDSVINIDDSAFRGCSDLKTIVLGNNIVSIGSAVFENCSRLKAITLPDKVSSIKYNTFYNCVSLESVSIPKSVKSIYEDSFRGCNNIKDVYYAGNQEDWEAIEIGANNYAIKDANIFFNSILPSSSETQPTESTETQPHKKDISTWKVEGVKNKTYTGKVIKQNNILVSKDGEYADFTIQYRNNVNVGTAILTITGTGNYTGTIMKTFNITKANNTIKITAKTKVSAKTKKKTTIKKAITVKKAQGKITYKTNNKKVIVKNGALIVKKGLKKGKTYKVKITITAKGNSNFKPKKIVKTIKIKVK